LTEMTNPLLIHHPKVSITTNRDVTWKNTPDMASNDLHVIMCLVNMRGEMQVIKGGLIQEKGLAVNYKKQKTHQSHIWYLCSHKTIKP